MMTDHNFPSRLYTFLEVVETYDLSHVASWQPHGRGFRIHNPKVFVKITTPSWFVYRKYSSFQRQLHIYGFQRITKGVDKNCYYHEHFLRGHYNLIHKMTRCPVKNGVYPLTVSTAKPQPDFYSMPAMPALSPNTKTSQCVSEDSFNDRPPECTGKNRLKPPLVSQFIQSHITDSRNARSNNAALSTIESAVSTSTPLHTEPSNFFATFSPPAPVDPSLMSLLERLKGMVAAQNETVSTQGNYTTNIISQNHQENLNAVTSNQSEANILSRISVQAEQNRILLHSLINQSQSNLQQQHSSSARPSSTLDLLQSLDRGATSFWDDLEQKRQSRATLASNEQIVRDNITFLNSSMPSSSQPPHANVGGTSYGGPLSSLTAHDDSSSPIIQFLKSQINTSAASDKSYTDSSSHDSTVAAGNLYTFFATNPLALRNQLW